MLQTPKEIRAALRLTQREMSERLGITRNYLALMETGARRVPPGVADRMQQMYVAAEKAPEADVTDVTPAPAFPGVRERRPDYICRIPESCDLPARLEAMEAAISGLASKLEGLYSVLGHALRSGIGRDPPAVKPDARKAG